MKYFKICGQILFVFISVIFIGCKEEKPVSVPEDLLSKDKMSNVLVDIHLAEASADNKGLKAPQVDLATAKRYQKLLAKHGISYEQFISSYNYYLKNTVQLAEIYNEVVIKLTAIDSRLQSQFRPKVPPYQAGDSLPHEQIRRPNFDSLRSNR